MFPTSAATLLPCLDDPFVDDLGSSPSLDAIGLDEIGALTVLSAMVEQRLRASRPAPAELDDRGDALAGGGAFMKIR